MNWVKKTFFEKGATEPPDESLSHSTGFHEYDVQPEPLDIKRSDVRAAREQIYACAKQTALIYGIPLHWLAFEVLTISDDQKAFFQVQILMLEWDEHLLSHSYAYDMALMKRLVDVNMTVARAVRAVLWRVKPDAGCPYDELPGPEAWTTDAIAAREARRLGMVPMPVPVDAQPLTDSERRALLRPDAFETVGQAFFASSAMDDVMGPVGVAKNVDTEVEAQLYAQSDSQPSGEVPQFEATVAAMSREYGREA